MIPEKKKTRRAAVPNLVQFGLIWISDWFNSEWSVFVIQYEKFVLIQYRNKVNQNFLEQTERFRLEPVPLPIKKKNTQEKPRNHLCWILDSFFQNFVSIPIDNYLAIQISPHLWIANIQPKFNSDLTKFTCLENTSNCCQIVHILLFLNKSTICAENSLFLDS